MAEKITKQKEKVTKYKLVSWVPIMATCSTGSTNAAYYNKTHTQYWLSMLMRVTIVILRIVILKTIRSKKKVIRCFCYSASQVFSPNQGRKATKSEKVLVGGIGFEVCFDLSERTYALALILLFPPLNWDNWHAIFFCFIFLVWKGKDVFLGLRLCLRTNWQFLLFITAEPGVKSHSTKF